MSECIEVPRTFTHDKAHRVATEVEEKVRGAIPDSSVLAHVDAVKTVDETILDRVRLIASETDTIKNVHSVYLSAIEPSKAFSKASRRKLHLYLDVQMDGSRSANSSFDNR